MTAVEDDGELRFTGVASEGGHSTVRILIWNQEDTEAVRQELRQMGCSSEAAHLPGLVAIDIAESANYGTIKRFLEEGQRSGRWDFEEGCIAHQEDLRY